MALCNGLNFFYIFYGKNQLIDRVICIIAFNRFVKIQSLVENARKTVTELVMLNGRGLEISSAITTTRSLTVAARMQRDALKHRAPSCFLTGGHEGRASARGRESRGDWVS